ncbi:kinase-like domain-containing protein [Aspergillus keveii]|uniref:Kinase-like domain-containing protein n=1 Tax=Aspergillus keveii TaxID=714993 RepID=A0ABR4G7A8_9EURO
MGANSSFSFPPGICIRDVKGCGTSGMVALVPNTKCIIKFPLGDEDECARCDHEREIYQLLETSSHERPLSLLRFHGSTSHGILLDYAEFGPVRQFLRESQDSIPTSTLFRWARQAAEALQFLHENSICHGDVNCTNFFLDQHLNLKVGDFTSSLVGSLYYWLIRQALLSPPARY